MHKIGITEAGDAGLDFSWIDKLFDINIIITKHLTTANKKLISALVENADKIILHCTCTGYGGTKMEPNVLCKERIYMGLLALIEAGFPVSHIVLRTDPIIPTEKGLKTVEDVWDEFDDLGIKRCRYSVIDMYPHTKERILAEYGVVPFETFRAPSYMMDDVRNLVLKHQGQYQFESCAENLPEQIGCVSKKDFDILGLEFDNAPGGYQRKDCLCCAGKTELLTNKKRCPSGCLYCYWRD